MKCASQFGTYMKDKYKRPIPMASALTKNDLTGLATKNWTNS